MLAENSTGTAVAVSSDGRTIYSGTSRGSIRAVETATGRVLWSQKLTRPVVLMTLSSDDQSLLVGMVLESSSGNYPQSSLVRVVAATGRTIVKYQLPNGGSYAKLMGAAFAGEGTLVLVSMGWPGYSDATLCQFSVSSDKLEYSIDHTNGSALACDDHFTLLTGGGSSVWRWDVRRLDAEAMQIPIKPNIYVNSVTITPNGRYAGIAYNDQGSTDGLILDLSAEQPVIHDRIPLTSPKLVILEKLGQFVGEYYSLKNYDLVTGELIGEITTAATGELVTAAATNTLVIAGTEIDAIDLPRDTTPHSVTRNISALRDTRFLRGDTTVAVAVETQTGMYWSALNLSSGKITTRDTPAPELLDETSRFRITTSRHNDTTYYTSLQTGRKIRLPQYRGKAYVAPDEETLVTYQFSPPSCGGPGVSYLDKFAANDLSPLGSATYTDYGQGYFAFARDPRYFILVSSMNVASILSASTLEELGKVTLDQTVPYEWSSAYYLPSTDLLYSVSGSSLSAYRVADMLESKRVSIASAMLGSTYHFVASPSDNTLLLISDTDWRLLDGRTLKLLATGARSSSAPDIAFSSDMRYRLQLTEDGILQYALANVNQPALHAAPSAATSGKVTVLPNPVRENAELDINGVNAAEINVEIYDLTGRRVLRTESITPSHISLDCSTLPAGSYQARVIDRATEAIIGVAKLEIIH